MRTGKNRPADCFSSDARDMDAPRKRSKLLSNISLAAVGSGAVVGLFEIWRSLFRNGHLFAASRAPMVSWNPADYGLDPTMVDELEFESDDGTLLHGWYCRAADPIASVLYFHGNSANLTMVAPKIPHLNLAGLNVLVFDYRGFGRSSGRPTLTGVLEDGLAAARLHDALRPPRLPSILFGYSLGGAIAAETATRHRFDGLILQSTFTNLADMARVMYPRLPMHLLSGRAFDTLKIIKQLELPLVVIHGTDDPRIPCWMAEQLFEECATRHTLHLVPAGDHGNLFDVDADRLVDLLVKFASSIRAHEPPPEASAERRRSLASAVIRSLRQMPPLRPELLPIQLEAEEKETGTG